MNIDLNTAEALVVLGAIQDKALDASRLAAISTGDEHEIADLSWKILGRVATQIVDALYPPVEGDFDRHPVSGFAMSES